ncbi:MAG: sigma-70 family RNA polymerase sigma factor [Spirochaetales bacterium]|nr:sigma-70 family RNA polymerase sigma factor [Spirochaetales bacterium]
MVVIVILSDKEFSLLKKRDRTVLARVYRHYADSITTYFMGKTFWNADVAEDLLQETFHAIITSAPRIKTPRHLQFFIFSIARNKLADYQRSLFRQKDRFHRLKEEVDIENDIVETIEQKQKLLLLKLARETLNPLYREIYDLYYVNDTGIAEIAAIYKKTYKAVDNILVRIRKALKKEMKRCAKDFFNDNEDE